MRPLAAAIPAVFPTTHCGTGGYLIRPYRAGAVGKKIPAWISGDFYAYFFAMSYLWWQATKWSGSTSSQAGTSWLHFSVA